MFGLATEKCRLGRRDFPPIPFRKAAIGRPFISNPDLVERYRNGWPLAEESDPATWYVGGLTSEGYTDYPSYAATT